jgi:DNA-binding MarR family transcriptional regulator
VRREADPKDRRSAHLLTPAGQALIDEIFPQHAVPSRRFSVLTAEEQATWVQCW